MKTIIGLVTLVIVFIAQTSSAQFATGNKGGFAIGGFNPSAVAPDIGNHNTSRSNKVYSMILQGGPISVEIPLDFKYLGLGYSVNLSTCFYLTPKVDFDWNVTTIKVDENPKIPEKEEKVFRAIPGLAAGVNILKIGRLQSYVEFNAFYNGLGKKKNKESDFEYTINIGVVFQIIKPSPDLTHIRIVKEGDRLPEAAASPNMGEPVPGVDITLKQESGSEPIANTTTNSAGEFSFMVRLDPGTYTIRYGINDEGTKATENKGGFAIGGFNPAIMAPDPGDEDEQEGDSVFLEVVCPAKESVLTKADSKKSLPPITISGEDETTLVRITVPKNSMPKKCHLKGTLVAVPATKVVSFFMKKAQLIDSMAKDPSDKK